MMKNDKTFTQDKLVQILVSSSEYSRFEKLQTNEANGTVLGGVTDRQISLSVDTIYAQITGEQIDEDTLKFLKKKFIESELDEDKLKSFIKEFVVINTTGCSSGATQGQCLNSTRCFNNTKSFETYF